MACKYSAEGQRLKTCRQIEQNFAPELYIVLPFIRKQKTGFPPHPPDDWNWSIAKHSRGRLTLWAVRLEWCAKWVPFLPATVRLSDDRGESLCSRRSQRNLERKNEIFRWPNENDIFGYSLIFAGWNKMARYRLSNRFLEKLTNKLVKEQI